MNPFIMRNNLTSSYKARIFFVLFLCFLFAFYLGAIRLIPDNFFSGAINLTGYLVVLFSKFFGIPATYGDTLVTVSGFKMLINVECTAFFFLAIFSAGVFAYPLHAFRYKMLGFFAGCIFIMFMNILRIVVLGLVGAKFPDIYNFVHAYLWQGAFVLVVFSTWVIWVRKALISGHLLKFFSSGIVTAAASVLFLGIIMETYLGVLAFFSERLLKLMAPRLTGSFFSVTAIKDKIAYQYLENMFYFPVSVDIFDSVIFFILFFATANAKDMINLSKKVLQGAGILSVLHLAFVIIAGFLVIREVRAGLIGDIMWMMRGVSIAVPVVLWFYLRIRSETAKGLLD